MIDQAKIFASKILIVDDKLANVQLLEMMLQSAGYRCVTSTMDPAAVSALHLENRYDLILLDLLMPGMDGFQVIEALKKLETDDHLSVLVITAQPSQKVLALKAGAKDFISKPFDNAEVLTRIYNMVETRLLHEECKAHNRLLEETVLERTAELRRSEEMFRELADNIPEALSIRDEEQQTIQYVNLAWQKLSGGYAAPGTRSSRPIGSFIPTTSNGLPTNDAGRQAGKPAANFGSCAPIKACAGFTRGCSRFPIRRERVNGSPILSRISRIAKTCSGSLCILRVMMRSPVFPIARFCTNCCGTLLRAPKKPNSPSRCCFSTSTTSRT